MRIFSRRVLCQQYVQRHGSYKVAGSSLIVHLTSPIRQPAVAQPRCCAQMMRPRLIGAQRTFRIIKRRQRNGPLQAQRLIVPIKGAEHIQELPQHLQPPKPISLCRRRNLSSAWQCDTASELHSESLQAAELSARAAEPQPLEHVSPTSDVSRVLTPHIGTASVLLHHSAGIQYAMPQLVP